MTHTQVSQIPSPSAHKPEPVNVELAKTLKSSIFIGFGLGLVSLLATFLIPDLEWERLQTVSILSFGLSLLLAFLYWRRAYRLATYGMLVGYSIITIYGAVMGIGVRGAAYAAFSVVVLLASLFVHRWAGYFVAGGATLCGLGLIWANRAGLLPNVNQPLSEVAIWLNVSVYFFATALLLDLTLRQVDRALREKSQAQEELQRLNAELEAHVQKRTTQLAESEARYRLIAENASDVIWTLDLNLRPTYISPSAERTRGYPISEMMQQTIAEMLTPDSYHKVQAILDEEMSKPDFHLDPNFFRILELEFTCKDGRTHWSEVKVSVLRDNLGQPTGLLGVGRDINQRRLTEQALREREERYRLISAVSSDYVFSSHLGPEGQFITDWVAGAFEWITGYTFEEYQARGGWLSILHPDDVEQDMKDVTALRQNQRVTTEIRILHKDGSTRWLRVYAHPVWDAQQNQVTGIYGAGQDITETKRNEFQARQRREMLEKVIQLGKAVTQYPDLQSCLRQIYHSIRYELGFDRVGLLLYDPVKNEFQDAFSGPTADIEDSSWYLRARSEHETWNMVMKTPKGLALIEEFPPLAPLSPGEKTRPTRQHATLAAWAGDKPVALIAVDNALTRHPMSEEKLEALKLFAGYAGLAIENARWNAQLEQRVTERTIELEAANQELQSFTYTIAHDLRAPARAMIGFSRLLQEEYAHHLDAQGQHYLNRVNYGAQRMGKMIDELLSFTQLGRQLLHKTLIPMTALVHQVLVEFQPELDERQVHLKLEPLPDVEADVEMIEKVWRHLVDNALKFTRQTSKPEIIIGAHEDKNPPEYFIRDNGVGFDIQYAHKLFEVFHRLHLEEEYEGTGMGLAIVHRIITRHGGRIWAEAEVDKGATFYFTLTTPRTVS